MYSVKVYNWLPLMLPNQHIKYRGGSFIVMQKNKCKI